LSQLSSNNAKNLEDNKDLACITAVDSRWIAFLELPADEKEEKEIFILFYRKNNLQIWWTVLSREGERSFSTPASSPLSFPTLHAEVPEALEFVPEED